MIYKLGAQTFRLLIGLLVHAVVRDRQNTA
jgi:hypothetical protein